MHGVALGIGCTILIVAFFMSRRSRRPVPAPVHPQNFFPTENTPVQRPVCWIAIRSVSLEAVQQALGLNRAEPCSWVSGLSGDHGFFISPRVHGWVIVTGNALPTPTEDVDAVLGRRPQEMRETRHDPALAADHPEEAEATQPAKRTPVTHGPAPGGIDPKNPDTWGKTPRNAVCPCGSGKKYKQCHGKV